MTDAQDPLPESNWTWRRTVTIAVLAASFAILAGCGFSLFKVINGIIDKLDAMSPDVVGAITIRALSTVEQMFRLMFWILLVTITYYMVAPSAEQVVKMMQTAGMLKAGVQIASRTIETPVGREVAATSGLPPQPVPPPIVDQTAPLPDEMPPIIKEESRG